MLVVVGGADAGAEHIERLLIHYPLPAHIPKQVESFFAVDNVNSGAAVEKMCTYCVENP